MKRFCCITTNSSIRSMSARKLTKRV